MSFDVTAMMPSDLWNADGNRNVSQVTQCTGDKSLIIENPQASHLSSQSTKAQMDIFAITSFNIVIMAVTQEIPSYPVQTMGIFASTDNNGTSTAPQ